MNSQKPKSLSSQVKNFQWGATAMNTGWTADLRHGHRLLSLLWLAVGRSAPRYLILKSKILLGGAVSSAINVTTLLNSDQLGTSSPARITK